MRLTRMQTVVITVLNVVIAALVAVIFLLPNGAASDSGGKDGGNDDPTVADPEQPTEHVKNRDAVTGRVPEILRETRLMGTGDESVVDVFFTDDMIYVFGNATVADYDFDSYGGFLCRIDSAGSIKGFEYYDGRMTAVGMVEGGYAVATVAGAGTDAERAMLYFTPCSGETVKVAEPDGAAVDVMAVDGNVVAVVTRPNRNSFKLTEYAADAEAWTAERSTHISSGYDLDYFDCYRLGEQYIIAARASSLPRYDSIVFFEFQAGGDSTAHFYGGSGDGTMQPYAVMPYAGGYLALCRREGVAAVVSIDYKFMSYRRDLLGFAFSAARLCYINDMYYACFECAGGAVTYEIDNLLNRRMIASADGLAIDCTVESSGTALCGTVENGIRMVDLSGTRTVSLAVVNGEVCGGRRMGDSSVFVLTATGGDALTPPSGGKDIYVVAVRL